MSAAGARVGDFELLARLGAGGQGEVFLARPWAPATIRRCATGLLLRRLLACGRLGAAAARRGRLAAVKIARRSSADSLHDEHQHLAGQPGGHPHLVSLYSRRFGEGARDLGHGVVGEGRAPRVYLACAYEPGLPLDRLLAARRAPPPPGWSLALALQVAGALELLHLRGIVHHDVRPANLIVRGGGRPHAVLIDLGAAETPAAPRRRAVYGAPGQLPPERAGTAPEPASYLVDIFGIGALLAALTAGAPVAGPLAELIAAATAAETARRRAAFPSIAELRRRLELLAAGDDCTYPKGERSCGPS
jgi:serine/threonine protein kinase